MTGMPEKAGGRQLPVRARFGLMRWPRDYSCVVGLWRSTQAFLTEMLARFMFLTASDPQGFIAVKQTREQHTK